MENGRGRPQDPCRRFVGAEPTSIFEARRDGYLLTTDRARIDAKDVHRFLAEDSYWARGISLDIVTAALEGSLPVGVFAPDGRMAAFGRVVTDYAMFA